MNPPASAAEGAEAGNLNRGHVIGMGPVSRGAKARPADVASVPPPIIHDPDAIEAAIDEAYQSLMRSTSDSERRTCCDRMKFWIARVKGIETKKPEVLA